MALLPRFETARAVLGTAVAALAIGSFSLALFLPVYTDEIVWKAAQGRMNLDGGSNLAVTLQPSCGAYTVPVPPLLYPFRLLDAALYWALSDPLAIRVFGAAVGFFWITLVGWLAIQVCRNEVPRATVLAVLLGFVTLGVMPFYLVISRPEQFMLLGMTCFALPLLRPLGPPPRLAASALRAAGGVILSAFVLAAHPRAALALPLMLAFVYRMARHRWIGAAAIVSVLIFAAIASSNWVARTACLADPHFATILMTDSIGTALEQGQFATYLRWLGASLMQVDGWYLDQFVAAPAYTAGLLPPFPYPILGRATTIGFAVFVIEGLLAFFFAAITQRKRVSWLPIIAIGSMWLFYCANVVIRVHKNDYEAELMEPVMVMAALGSFWLAWPSLVQACGEASMRFVAHAGIIVLLVMSIVSQMALLDTYVPIALTAWQKPGYPLGQRYSVSIFGYNKLVPEMRATAALCGINPAAHPRHLVVDELASFLFRGTVEPYFLTFFDERSWGRFRPDPTALWREKRVAGMIAACERVPSAFADKVIRSGMFCCLPSFGPS